MTPHPTETTPEIAPALPRVQSRISLADDEKKDDITHIEHGEGDNDLEEATIGDHKPHYTREDAKHSVGLAIIDQVNTIPSAGERKVTHWKEYWSYILFGQSPTPSCPGTTVGCWLTE